MLKIKFNCSGRFKGPEAWEYARTIGNGYSSAHAEYGANRKKNIYFVTKLLLLLL